MISKVGPDEALGPSTRASSPALRRTEPASTAESPWKRWDIDGPRTHALVIGVSHYVHLPDMAGEPSPTDPERLIFRLAQLKTPATGALRFAEWLRDRYNMPNAPKGTIRLLLSPSDFERQNVDGFASIEPNVLPATRANVVRALNDWWSACRERDENVAILYAGGHGIELTKDDGGIVLLEDFADSKGSVLEQSLDVGRVRNGMGGHPMAQRQFYFVDACRVPPEELADFDTQGAGVALQSPRTGAAHSTPMYFSAAPTTAAYGKEIAGTIFAEALIDCLELLGVDKRDPQGNWYCSTTALIPALEKRVKEIAAELEVEQTAVPGGTPTDTVMHVLSEPPTVSLRIRVSPDEAAQFCRASLRENPSRNLLWERRPLEPELVAEVPAGSYFVGVEIHPRNPSYRDIDIWPAAARPPVPEPIVLPVDSK